MEVKSALAPSFLECLSFQAVPGDLSWCSNVEASLALVVPGSVWQQQLKMLQNKRSFLVSCMQLGATTPLGSWWVLCACLYFILQKFVSCTGNASLITLWSGKAMELPTAVLRGCLEEGKGVSVYFLKCKRHFRRQYEVTLSKNLRETDG